MLREIIENTILKKRPELIDVRTYGTYSGYEIHEAIYNDAEKNYKTKILSSADFTVRSAKAFTDFINEELKRRENKTGDMATVHLTLSGGEFIADCNFKKGTCKYQRLYSEGYEILKTIKDTEFNHEKFLYILRKLKPFIVDFNELYKTCSKIKLLKSSKVTSQPIFNEDGEKDSSFTCVYQLETGEENEFNLPASFFVQVPFAKAGDKKYTYEIELMYTLDDFGGLLITLKIPDWETTEEQAIFDEAAQVKDAVKEANDLLILSDF